MIILCMSVHEHNYILSKMFSYMQYILHTTVTQTTPTSTTLLGKIVIDHASTG